MSGYLRLFGAASAMAMLLPASHVAAQTGAAEAASVGAGELEEVIVTARRRAEDLQTTPVSETAFTSREILERNIRTVTDIANNTPNLAITQASGSRNGAILTMRGQVQSNSLITLDPSVGVYQDDVYLARAYAVLTDFLDIELVEVLRGPQGTLYGRNTPGGAIKVVTRKPILGEFGGRLQATVGNFDTRELTGVVNIPLGEVAALRWAGSQRRHSGYTSSYFVPRLSTTPLTRLRTDDQDSFSQRLGLRVEPSDRLTLDLSADYFEADDAGNLSVDIRGDIAATTGRSTSPQRAGDFYSALVDIVPYSKAKSWGGSFATSYEITDDITTKLILAHRGSRQSSNINTDGVVAANVLPLELNSSVFQNQKQSSAEWQVLGDFLEGRLSAIAGVYYFREHGDDTTYSGALAGGVLSPTLFDGSAVNKSVSGFGHLTFNVTDDLRLSGGVRVTHDTKRFVGRNRVRGVCVYPAGGAGVVNSGATCTLATRGEFDFVSWSFGADYQLADGLFIYAKADRGQRSGGQQARGITPATLVPFDPEEATNYEAGVKSDMFGNRVRLNATVFHTRITGSQQSFTFIIPGVGNAQVIQNSGKAEVDVSGSGSVRLTRL